MFILCPQWSFEMNWTSCCSIQTSSTAKYQFCCSLTKWTIRTLCRALKLLQVCSVTIFFYENCSFINSILNKEIIKMYMCNYKFFLTGTYETNFNINFKYDDLNLVHLGSPHKKPEFQ